MFSTMCTVPILGNPSSSLHLCCVQRMFRLLKWTHLPNQFCTSRHHRKSDSTGVSYTVRFCGPPFLQRFCRGGWSTNCQQWFAARHTRTVVVLLYAGTVISDIVVSVWVNLASSIQYVASLFHSPSCAITTASFPEPDLDGSPFIANIRFSWQEVCKTSETNRNISMVLLTHIATLSSSSKNLVCRNGMSNLIQLNPHNQSASSMAKKRAAALPWCQSEQASHLG